MNLEEKGVVYLENNRRYQFDDIPGFIVDNFYVYIFSGAKQDEIWVLDPYGSIATKVYSFETMTLIKKIQPLSEQCLPNKLVQVEETLYALSQKNNAVSILMFE